MGLPKNPAALRHNAASGPLPPGAVAGPVPYARPRAGWNGLLLLGEVPGSEEVNAGVPFAGPAGRLLDRCLEEAAILRHQCWIANAIRYRPEENRVRLFFADPADPTADIAPSLPAAPHGLLLEAYLPEIRFLWQAILDIQPAVILALGATATWAATGLCGVTKHRGTVHRALHADIPVVPTFHPASALPSRTPENAAAIVEDLTGPVKTLLVASGYTEHDNPDARDHAPTRYAGHVDKGTWNTLRPLLRALGTTAAAPSRTNIQ